MATLADGANVTVATRGATVAEGDRVLLLARPSAIAVRPGSADGLNGEVMASAFAGERLRLEVQVAGIGLFRCTAPLADADSLSRGTHVHLLVDRDAWTIVGPSGDVANA